MYEKVNKAFAFLKNTCILELYDDVNCYVEVVMKFYSGHWERQMGVKMICPGDIYGYQIKEMAATVVDKFQELDIPLSVFHFDCCWMKCFHWCDFIWDKEIFPKPEEILARLVWQSWI